ncbi:MAG TPA: flagellar hook-basal body protein [Verrucomicrobiae bacterium]|nr:flagellar hook-basal body protein [Verrucomicrobiae bacterium]
MDVSLYQAAAAMHATAQWQDLIAENLATSQVPGGRKREIVFSDVMAGRNAAVPGNPNFYIPSATTVTNFQPGELHASSNPMDFALDGPGFFTVQLPNGQTAYTRGGQFELNAQGQLVTNQGYLVMGAAGPLQFNPNSSDPITISATGEVSQGQQQVGKLNLVEFDNPGLLTVIGAGDFQSGNSVATPHAATLTKVRQGFLEAANSSPTREMSGMVTAMRAFEANQKVMQADSDRMSRTITELGGIS